MTASGIHQVIACRGRAQSACTSVKLIAVLLQVRGAVRRVELKLHPIMLLSV
jgi:hypothetical protein